MRKLISATLGAVLAASVFVSGAIAAPLAPMHAPSGDVVQVRDFDNGREWLRGHRMDRGNFRRLENGQSFRRFNDNDGNWDWRHRSHYRHDGWRYHDGYWYPGAAFLGGVIVGDLINRNDNIDDGYYVRRHRVGLSRAHVQWCYDRYRSYRSYDNSFQPYNGPRQQCYSPYS